MLKRIFSIFAIALIITGLFFEGYSLNCPVYADDTTDGWTQVTTNEQLADAFRAYCKSRDLTIEGSLADGVTSFTTKTFNGLCNVLGYDMTALQAQVKYRTDGNLGLQYLFTATGIDAYNQLFAQFLQDNELEVGDEVENKELYNGYSYTDPHGNISLVYILPTNKTSSGKVQDTSTGANWVDNIIYGTPYLGYGDQNFPIGNITLTPSSNITYTSNLYSFTITNSVNNVNYKHTGIRNDNNPVYTVTKNLNNGNMEITRNGFYGIYKFQNSTQLYFGLITMDNYENIQTIGDSYGSYYKFRTWIYEAINNISEDDYVTTIIYLTTNNNVINNNNYEGDTIINNNGTTGDDDPPIDPPNPDPPTIPDDGGWQDFQLPSMPNDWLIYGMEKKFPFDIPFNIMFGLSLLNHEPEIPKFQGDIDLKVCTWHYDIDLTPFDDIAKILRKFEVLAFIIGLAILTKELIMWG